MKKKSTKHSAELQTRTTPCASTGNPVSGDVASVALDEKNSRELRNKEKFGSKCAPSIKPQTREACLQLVQQHIVEYLDLYRQTCSVDLKTLRLDLCRIATEIQHDETELAHYKASPTTSHPAGQKYIAALEKSHATSVNLYEAIMAVYEANQRFAVYKKPLSLSLGAWVHLLKANCDKTEWSALLNSVGLSTRVASRLHALFTEQIKMRSNTDTTGNAVETVYEAALKLDIKQKEALWNLVEFDR